MAWAIEVKNVSKLYRKEAKIERKDTLVEQLWHSIKKPLYNFRRLREMSAPKSGYHSKAALKNVSLNCHFGEVLGIIGPNGSGKSTLLKLIGRISPPSSGEIRINGRLSSLLEIGTGFHSELSGRENIYLNGSILGMKKNEIRDRMAQIIEFSGVEEYIDTPIKFYSSGMKVRLGFSVAAWLNSDILLVDEVLAVGDHEFRKKCLGFMDKLPENGRTVLFVSHDMEAIEEICHRVVFLKDGEIASVGKPSEVIARYLGYRGERIAEKGVYTSQNFSAKYQIRSAEIRDKNGGGNKIPSGGVAYLECDYKAPANSKPQLFAGIFDSRGRKLVHLSSGGVVSDELPSRGKFICEISELNLLPGKYVVNLSLFAGGKYREQLNEILGFEVVEGRHTDRFGPQNANAVVYLNHRWKVNPQSNQE